jgi:hypothetical protein
MALGWVLRHPSGRWSAMGRNGADAVNLKSMHPPQVFIIAPFDPDGQRLQNTVRNAIEEAGFRVARRNDAVRPGAELASSILDGIREADLIIADVSRPNPNVFYEMGFAHALGKPTFLLFDIRSGSSLPSDLAGLEYITYDPANFRGLADLVQTVTRASAGRGT